MYAERETFGPANLSIVATRSSDRVSDVFAFILPLYYQSRIRATRNRAADWRRAKGLHRIAMEGSTARHTPRAHSGRPINPQYPRQPAQRRGRRCL